MSNMKQLADICCTLLQYDQTRHMWNSICYLCESYVPLLRLRCALDHSMEVQSCPCTRAKTVSFWHRTLYNHERVLTLLLISFTICGHDSDMEVVHHIHCLKQASLFCLFQRPSITTFAISKSDWTCSNCNGWSVCVCYDRRTWVQVRTVISSPRSDSGQ